MTTLFLRVVFMCTRLTTQHSLVCFSLREQKTTTTLHGDSAQEPFRCQQQDSHTSARLIHTKFQVNYTQIIAWLQVCVLTLWSVCLSVHSSIHLSVWLSVCLVIHPLLIHSSIHPLTIFLGCQYKALLCPCDIQRVLKPIALLDMIQKVASW